MNASSTCKVRQITYTTDRLSITRVMYEKAEERTETETFHNNTLPGKACVAVQLNAHGAIAELTIRR